MGCDDTWPFILVNADTHPWQRLPGALEFCSSYEKIFGQNFWDLDITNIYCAGIHTCHSISRICVASCHIWEYLYILNQYTVLLQSVKNTDSGKHQTRHLIKISRKPTYFCSWWLLPHKLLFAKKASDEMLNDATIHRSNSPYTSQQLHLDHKHGCSDFQIYMNYW